VRQLEQDVGPGEKLQMPLCSGGWERGGCYEQRETSGETLESQARQGSSSIAKQETDDSLEVQQLYCDEIQHCILW